MEKERKRNQTIEKVKRKKERKSQHVEKETII